MLAFERLPRPGTARPARPEAEDRAPRPNVSVIFTSEESTLRALDKASALASSLGARITLLVPQEVPHPLPLENPPVPIDWNERRFRAIAEQSPVETSVRIYLCRDGLETVASVLNAGSIVVLDARRRWWPTAESRLARSLRKAGHKVIVAERE